MYACTSARKVREKSERSKVNKIKIKNRKIEKSKNRGHARKAAMGSEPARSRAPVECLLVKRK